MPWPQAADYLAKQLPPGTSVRLEFDAERHDRYGRTLAGVFAPNGTLVNAEIAREGLGIPVQYGNNSKFLPPVEAAYEEARSAKTGLFSDQIDCTLPTQLAETTKALDAATAAAPATTSAAAGTAFAALVTEIAAAKSLRAVLAASKETQRALYWAGLSAAALAGNRTMVDKKIASAEKTRDKTKALQATLAADEKRAEEERVAAQERAGAEKKAADEAAAAAKTAAEEAPRMAPIEAPRQRNLPAPYVPPAPAPHVPPAPRPYVPPAPAPYVPPANPKYTGPRCYAPGGKTYRPC